MKKSKKLLSVLLAVLMLLSVMPMSTYAATTNTPLSGGGALNGSYYLSKDVTLSKDITVASGKTLDLYLNDYILNLNGYRIIVDGTLNLYDALQGSAKASTTRYFTDNDGDGCYESFSLTTSEGVIAVVGGVITGGDASAENVTHGGAVCNNGTFNMNAGNIVGNKLASGKANSALGGGVYNGGTFIMNGGMISGNLVYGQTDTYADNMGGGVYNDAKATFTLNKGTVSYNKATGDGANEVQNCLGYGGGVCNDGTFIMNDGAVADNNAQENGGGVCNDGTFIMNDGAIADNNAQENGGGIASGGTLTIADGTITGNGARWGGGIENSGTADISGGTFTDNTAYGGAAIDNAGALTVTGGTFENNTAAIGSGIYAFKGFTIGGDVQLTANKNRADRASNVYLKNGALITPDNYTGTCTVSKSGTTGVISTVTDKKYTGNFISENTSYGVRFNADGALEISDYIITVNTVTGGKITSDKTTSKVNEKVTLAVTANNGYKSLGYTVTRDDTGEEITVSNNTFTMPDSNVTVKGTFETAASYTITEKTPSNGIVKINGSTSTTINVYDGSKVTLSSSPTSGYALQEYVVYKTGDFGTKVTVTDDTFVMPAYPVTVTAIFAKDNTDYLKFTSDASFKIKPNAYTGLTTIQYSTDKANWYSVTSSTAISSSASSPYVLYFRGTGGTGFAITNYSYAWTLTPAEGHKIAASGNIMTLLNYKNPDNAKMADYAFAYMFRNQTSLVTAPKLPATKLSKQCYCSMFKGTGLISAPELPATTLAAKCYSCMFMMCTSLTTAPNLPATTLAENCYDSMFWGCTSLTTAPELPATTLTENCYQSMFQNCTSLTRVPEIAATDFSGKLCCNGMFIGCTGLNLYTDGAGEYFIIPDTTLGTNSLLCMFSGIGSNGNFSGTPEVNTKYYYSQTAVEDKTDYLKFTSDASFSITPNGLWEGTLQYSTDKYNWNTVTSGKAVTAEADNGKYTLYFRGIGNTVITGQEEGTYNSYMWTLSQSGDNKIAASGNIMTLLNYKDPDNAVMGSCAFQMMFYGWKNLVTSPELPATTLAYCCYCMMFACTGLTETPELPATTLAVGCYSNMFTWCTSLKKSSELPATTLVLSCYGSMFKFCTGLTEAPDLPATTLADSCYISMFLECTSLTEAPDLPATTLAANCYSSMFRGCTSLKEAPDLPATTLAANCYSSMFNGCTSLTTAPLLPASSFNYGSCCSSMFKGCTKLKITTEAPEDSGSYNIWYFKDSASDSFTDMITGTASDSSIATPAIDTVYYIMTNDGNGNYTYNKADNVTVNDSINKAVVGYSGANIVVNPNTPANYTLKSITALTESIEETDITESKEIACVYGEIALVTLSSMMNIDVNKKIETDTGITVSESKVQSYVNNVKDNATNDTTYKFTVKEQTPEAAIKTDVENKAGVTGNTQRTVTFYDATLTKTETVNNVAQSPEEISDTDGTILSFTISYDMTNRCDLAVYRYHNEAEALTRVYTTLNPQDGTYYVSGTGADTKITVFASKFCAFANVSTLIPEEISNATYSASLTLYNDITMNIRISGLKDGFDKSKLEVTADGNAISQDNITYDKSTNTCIVKYTGVTSEKMAEKVKFVVNYNGVNNIATFNYSVKIYCDKVLTNAAYNDAKYANLRTLCKAVLEYGAESQKYLAKKNSTTVENEALATYGIDNLTDFSAFTFSDEFANADHEGVRRGIWQGITLESANLTIGSNIAINIAFKNSDDMSGYTFDSNGTAVEVNDGIDVEGSGENAVYTISYGEFGAADFDKEIPVMRGGTSLAHFSYSYSVNDYCYAVISSTDSQYDDVKDLCKAIYNYGVAAKAYVGG